MKTTLITTIFLSVTIFILSCQEKADYRQAIQPDPPLKMPHPEMFQTDIKIDWSKEWDAKNYRTEVSKDKVYPSNGNTSVTCYDTLTHP